MIKHFKSRYTRNEMLLMEFDILWIFNCDTIFSYRDLQNNAIQLKKKMILLKINEIKAKRSNNSYTLLND